MTWSDYMRNYGYREYPCIKHDKAFCLECYGPEPEELTSVSAPCTADEKPPENNN